MKHMALGGYSGHSEWETSTKGINARLDIRKDVCINNDVSAHGLIPLHRISEGGPLNEMDSTWRECTTSPPLSPVEELSVNFHQHNLGLCEGQSFQPTSPNQAEYCEAGQQHRLHYDLAHPRAGLSKSNSMNEFSDCEAKTVGHGRPRSRSQPLPPNDFSPPSYAGKNSFHGKDGFYKQALRIGSDSSIPETNSSSWNGIVYKSTHACHVRPQGRTNSAHLKLSRLDALLPSQDPSCDKHQCLDAALENAWNLRTLKQGTKMKNVRVVDQFPSGDPAFSSSSVPYNQKNSNPSSSFPNGNRYKPNIAAGESRQGTKTKNVRAVDQLRLSADPFPSSSLLYNQKNSNPSSSFPNGNRYKPNTAADESRQGLGAKRFFPAAAISSCSMPQTCAPTQRTNVCHPDSLVQNGDDLSDDVFTKLHEEHARPNGSRLRSMDSHQRNILEVFFRYSNPLGPVQIANAIGSVTISDVESSLYTLQQMGVLKLITCQPPLWTLSAAQDKERQASPGVIGGEKKRRESKRSVSEMVNEQECLTGTHFLKDFTTRERSEQPTNICSKRDDENYPSVCAMCKVSLTTEEQAAEHFNSNKHRNKVSKYKHPMFCDYCKVNLNSESQAMEHFNSGRHEQTVAKSQKAPVKIHPPLVVVNQSFAPICNTKTSPDGYQIELYEKAMTTGGVCFLPTGTGKALVSALVIAHTLQLNPTRQVIFLVDRVLLVLQQSDYMKQELGHLTIQVSQSCGPPSHGASQHYVGERPIRIGAVCGEMRKLDGQARIFEHDVLVITADCYRNHLSNKTLRVEDVSLIVLDEAHHCNKDHPYNVIMREHYLHEDSFLVHKPKVLGLTTSAAGELSLERTTKKLQRLLSNLGNAALLTVTDRVEELEEKTNQAELVCLRTEYTQAEKRLFDGLVEYATKCFNQAVRMSELKNYKEIFQPSAGNFLNKEDIFPILRVVDSILLQSVPADGDAHSSLLHFRIICEAICSLQECGARLALEGLTGLCDDRCSHGFDWAQKKGLSCDIVRCFLDRYLLEGAHYSEDLGGMDSGVTKLLEQVKEVNWHPTHVNPMPLALVLVKRPSTAYCLASYLSGRQELLKRNARTAFGVSPGGRSMDRGAIFNIRGKECQVVVATDVAEEGLDLAACELVIQLDPPCSVTALSQIRSHAWRRETRLVAICRDEEQSRRIQELLRREEHMKMATHNIVFT